MKRENIIQRIENFFADYEEPKRTEYVKYCIRKFDEYRKDFKKELSDSRLIPYAIEYTLKIFGLYYQYGKKGE